MPDNRPVGFFDSGLGGLSVLRETRRLLPAENYIYYGDSANAPYGEKTPEQICLYSDAIVQKLLAMNIKAAVVACNTATGEAVDFLRAKYPELIIIGVEPAIKPAVEQFPGGRIPVLATPQCLRSRRVTQLIARYSGTADVIPVPCPGLMEFVERGELESDALLGYLRERLGPLQTAPISAAVLGCTHYPFVRRAISRVLGNAVPLIDGNAGIAAQLRRRLAAAGLLSEVPEAGTVSIFNSSDAPQLLSRSRMLLELPDE